MTAAPIHLGRHRIMLDPLGGAVWPDEGVLAVADMHLEKGSACARRGNLVPPWDTAVTLDRLALLIRRHRPRTVVALGDSFHDRYGAGRMAATDFSRLHAMAQAAAFVWVLGNHDPVPPDGLPGAAVAEWRHDGLVFRHEAVGRADPDSGELCGHHHPKAAIETRAGRVTRPCFVADAHRLMLPALGAYTGGLDIVAPPIARLFPRGGRAFLLGQGRLFTFTLSQVQGQHAVAQAPQGGTALSEGMAGVKLLP